MSKETLTKAISFTDRISKENNTSKTQTTFHSGQSFLTGKDFFNHAIPLIKEILDRDANLSMQSNLWLLDERLCELFKKYNVVINTKLLN